MKLVHGRALLSIKKISYSQSSSSQNLKLSSEENLFKDKNTFPLAIILLILITFFLEYVLIFLGETWSWSLFGRESAGLAISHLDINYPQYTRDAQYTRDETNFPVGEFLGTTSNFWKWQKFVVLCRRPPWNAAWENLISGIVMWWRKEMYQKVWWKYRVSVCLLHLLLF